MTSVFAYERPRDLETVLRILADRGDDATLLAGGLGLAPMLAAGTAARTVIVDLRGVEDLGTVTDGPDGLRIGAMVTHRQILEAPWTAMLEETAAGIGDAGVRTWGTIGGAVAEAHPASDWAAVLIALRASIVWRSLEGERVIGARDFYETGRPPARSPGEVLTEVRLPPKAPGGGAAYRKLARADGYAAVGVCARLVEVDGVITLAGIGVCGVGNPFAAAAAEAALVGAPPTEATFASAARAAAAQGRSRSDGEASAGTDAGDTHGLVRATTFQAISIAHERSVETARAGAGR